MDQKDPLLLGDLLVQLVQLVQLDLLVLSVQLFLHLEVQLDLDRLEVHLVL